MIRPLTTLLMIAALTAASCSGSGDGSAGADPLADGRALYEGNCAVCHGAAGQGSVGPALTGVLETFPRCDDQVRWISLGSTGWQRESGPTYGATGRQIEGPMPSFSATLGEDRIRLVAAWERFRFGGADPTEAAVDCGVG